MKICDFIENQEACIEGTVIDIGKPYKIRRRSSRHNENSLEFIADSYGLELEPPRKFFDCFLHDGTGTAKIRGIPEKYYKGVDVSAKLKISGLLTSFSTENLTTFVFTRNSKIWKAQRIYALDSKQSCSIKELIKNLSHEEVPVPYISSIVFYREVRGSNIDVKIDCVSI